jgi:dethiobiotin synthetase
MKPVAAGAHAAPGPHDQAPPVLRNDDALALAGASNVPVPYSTTNPYCLAEAVSPHIAAETAGISIDSVVICREFSKLKQLSDCVIVEGAGGWLAPIGGGRTMADIATALGLPVILVIGLRLGCLNHALLTAQAIRASALELAHWVGNAIDPSFERAEENVATLAAALGKPLALVPHRGTIGS